MKFLKVLTPAILALAVGCNATQNPNQKADPGDISMKFTTIAKTDQGPKDAQQSAITTDKQYEAIAKSLYGEQAVPKVDFFKEMVIVMAMGQKPTAGYSIEITKVEASKDGTITAYYREEQSKDGDQVLTRPAHAIKVDKPNNYKQTKFVKDKSDK